MLILVLLLILMLVLKLAHGVVISDARRLPFFTQLQLGGNVHGALSHILLSNMLLVHWVKSNHDKVKV